MIDESILEEAFNLNNIYNIAESKDWRCIIEEEYITFSTLSPAGQDFNIELIYEVSEDIVDELDNFINYFDVSYEAYLWLDKFGHGVKGAPYDMRDVYDDMEWCFDKSIDLYNALYDLNMKY